MKYFVLFAAIYLASVSDAQVTWFKASMTCNDKYSSVTVNEYSHFIAGQKLMIHLKKDGEFYANSKPCDKAEDCDTDVKLTTTCSRLGQTNNYVSLTTGRGGTKHSTGSPSGGNAADYCTDDLFAVESVFPSKDVNRCAKVERKVADANAAPTAATYKVFAGDVECDTTSSSPVTVSTTCAVIATYGSSIVKEGVLTLYPGDFKCGVVTESDTITFPAEGTCGLYETGKYAKYTVADGKATLKYGCTDAECSASCTTQQLEKDKCVAIAANAGSMLYGSLGLSGGAIAGIVIGSILGIALIAGIVIVVVKKSGGSSSSAV